MPIKYYKAFDKDLKSGGVQYEIGKDYVCCNSTVYVFKNPLAVLTLYNSFHSRFCEVVPDDVLNENEDDSILCSKKIHIGLEIGRLDLIYAGANFYLKKYDLKNVTKNNSIRKSIVEKTDYQSVAASMGSRSVAANTGTLSVAVSAGERSVAVNTGIETVAMNTGNQSVALNTGTKGASGVEGNEAIAIATGFDGRAKGALGCFIVLAEWQEDSNGEEHRINVKSAKVTGKAIKENVFYQLKNGKFVEAK